LTPPPLLLLPLLATVAATGCFRVEEEYVAVVPDTVGTNAAATATDSGVSLDVAKTLASLPVAPGLSFHLVAEDSESRAKALVSATDGSAPDGFLATEDDYGFARDLSKSIDSARLRAFGNPPAGQICLIERLPGNLYGPVFVETEPAFRQVAAMRSCKAETDPLNERNIVSATFGKRDAQAFAAVTSANAMKPGTDGRRLAIVLGDAVLCAPLILEPIRDGRFVISGSFSRDEVEILAKLIGSSDPAAAKPAPFVWDLFQTPAEASTPAPHAEPESHAESAESAEPRPGEAGTLHEGAAERSEAGGVSHAEGAESESHAESAEAAEP